MNAFYEHHRQSIHGHYRCFDRILLNALIQPFQQPERVVGFFNTYRQLYPVTRHTLRDRQAPPLPPLSTAASGLLDLRDIPQALRAHLRAARGRSSQPISADARLQNNKRSQLDRLYQRVVDDLDALVRALGLNLKAA
jgi:hypothetical protein